MVGGTSLHYFLYVGELLNDYNHNHAGGKAKLIA